MTGFEMYDVQMVPAAQAPVPAAEYQLVSGLPCGRCGGQDYEFAPAVFDIDDGSIQLADGWQCVGCSMIFLECLDADHRPGGERPGLESNSEIMEFMELLAGQSAEIVVADHGRSLGLRFPRAVVLHPGPASKKLSSLLYYGKLVPWLASLLPDGVYSEKEVLLFLGGGVNAKRGRGKAV